MTYRILRVAVTFVAAMLPLQVSSVAAASASGPGLIAIAMGAQHTCALTAGGGVKCWGFNVSGQLGNGSTTASSVPIDVTGLTSGVSAITAGQSHTCALTTGGGVKCWGSSFSGARGDGTTADSLTPVDVAGLTSGVGAISAGNLHTCAVTSGGAVKCWGYNNFGELGDGTTTDSLIPVDVSGLTSGVTAIAAGENFTCALTNGGGVNCWGVNDSGQLGNGSTTATSVPVGVSGLASGARVISAGYAHSCALTNGGAVKCWGENSGGQLIRDGTTADSLTPVDVSGLTSGLTAIAAGGGYTCALTNGGGVKCWGANQEGQLGSGTATDRVILDLIDVEGLSSGVSAIAAGLGHTCALTIGGRVKCWGWNTHGTLGDGTTTNSNVPVKVWFAPQGLPETDAAAGAHGRRAELPLLPLLAGMAAAFIVLGRRLAGDLDGRAQDA